MRTLAALALAGSMLATAPASALQIEPSPDLMKGIMLMAVASAYCPPEWRNPDGLTGAIQVYAHLMDVSHEAAADELLAAAQDAHAEMSPSELEATCIASRQSLGAF